MDHEWGVRPSVARVIGPSGDPVGAGFLVSPGLIVTAAHVVNLALGRDITDSARPEGAVRFDFPAAPGAILRADVLHWVAPATAPPEDVAVLRLRSPAPDGVRPARVSRRDDWLDRQVLTFGFPRDAPDGAWARGRLAAADARGYVQLDSRPDSQFDTEEGFSGTPVWDVAAGAVVGMVLQAWTSGRRSGFMVPATQVVRAWPELDEHLVTPSPFRGLAAYGEGDAGSFYGRSALVERIADLVRTAQTVTVIGPSGVGKSSLLHAGVVPRLRRRTGLVVAVTRPGDAQTPLRSVARALAGATHPELAPLAREPWVDGIAGRLTEGLVTEVVADVLETRSAQRLVLVIDALDEVFTAREEEIARFAAVLRPGPAFGLLTSLRADFLAQLLHRNDFGGLARADHLMTVPELTEAELREVITLPVRATGVVDYEPGLVDVLLDDAGTAPGRLPLLQFVLDQLWERQTAGMLTHAAYRELGEIPHALAAHAERCWARLADHEQLAAGRLLAQLLYPVDDDRFVRRAAPRSQLDDTQWGAAQRLAGDSARLVVIRARDDGEPVVELAHESLIVHWARLTEVGAAEREFREWQEALRRRLGRWQDDGCPARLLLPPQDLVEGRRWLPEHDADLSAAEREYLAASRGAATRQRRRRLAILAAVVAGLLLIGSAVWYGREVQVAQDAAANIIGTMPSPRQDGYAWFRETVRAYRTDADARTEAEVAQLDAEYGRTDQVIPDYTAPVNIPPGTLTDKVTADGRTLVTADPLQDVRLWHVDGGRVTSRVIGHGATQVAISRHGRYVTFTGGTALPCSLRPVVNCLFLYDTATGRTTPLGQQSGVLGPPVVRVDPTEHVVVTATMLGKDTHIAVRDIETGRRTEFTALGIGVDDMWLSSGATSMMFAGRTMQGGNTVLATMDLTAHPGATRVLEPLPVARDGVVGSLDGTRVAAMNGGGHITVWDLATGRRVGDIPVPTGPGPQTFNAPMRGALVLDADGSHVFLTYTSEGGRNTCLILSVGDGSPGPQALATRFPQNVVPLGSALALVEPDAIGLVLPAAGRPVPLQRLATSPDIPTGPHAEQWAAQLAGELATDVPAPGEIDHLPAGAYRGPLGPHA